MAASSPGDPKEGALNIILKASDSGSLEALSQILHAMSAEQPIRILSESVGEVGETDVKTAVSGSALVISFKSKTDKSAKVMAQAQGVEIIASDIIYDLIISIETKLKGLQTAGPTGDLEVLAVFNSAKLDKQVVGGKVAAGKFRKAAFQIKRGEETVGQGRVVNLQEQKKDTTEVLEGKECGVLVGSSVVIEKGDHLLIFAESQPA
jgi:translation initiation factor IF-2